MFRVFIRKKILTGDEQVKPSRGRNRRIFARYPIDHKHLKLLNEQDILMVKELSTKGFSTEVSQRGYERFASGDVYEARIRYAAEFFDLEVKVAWKRDQCVGFEIINANAMTMHFLKRLLRPVEIANSMKSVEAAFVNNSAGKSWFHGDHQTDLYVWQHPESHRLTAWQLNSGLTYVEWNDRDGLSTGVVSLASGAENLLGVGAQSQTHSKDLLPDHSKKQFVIDVIMAFDSPVRDVILKTIME
jgi:hypothetical protein